MAKTQKKISDYIIYNPGKTQKGAGRGASVLNVSEEKFVGGC